MLFKLTGAETVPSHSLHLVIEHAPFRLNRSSCMGHWSRKIMERKQIMFAALALVLAISAPAIGHAQSAIVQLQNLSIPTQRVTDSTAAVSFDIAFSAVTKGDALYAGIEDTEYRRFAVGNVTATSEPCISLGEKYSTLPFCEWRLNETSGSEHIEFQLKIAARARIYNLAAYAGLANSTGQTIPNSWSAQRFTIRGGSVLTLKVTVLDNVSVTLDGKQQTPGTISVDLVPGPHTISVPNETAIGDSTRLTFGGWNDASMQTNRTLDLETDTQMAAEYIKEYKLTLISPATANGAGWYYEGSVVQISVSPQLSLGFLGMLGATTHFDGWFENGQLKTKSYNATIQMNSPRTLTANWTTDYTTPAVVTLAGVAIVVVAVVLLRKRSSRSKIRS